MGDAKEPQVWFIEGSPRPAPTGQYEAPPPRVSTRPRPKDGHRHCESLSTIPCLPSMFLYVIPSSLGYSWSHVA